MNATRRILIVLVAGLAVLLPATTAGAASTTTYHGQFTGVTFVGCTPAHTAEATGTWSFAEHNKTGTLAVNIFLDGRHHVAFGGTLPLVDDLSQAPDAEWAVQFETAAGLLSIWLDGSQLTYQVGEPGPEHDYNLGSLACDYVTYVGSTR